MNPLFSVVIPLYNKESVIERTIHSVLSQTVEDYEIIVVNDGSTDNSQMIVEKIENLKIKLIVQENQGASAARNRGIESSIGQYIAFLDGDDVWKPNHLFVMRNLINKFPYCGMYATAHNVKLETNKEKFIDFGFEENYEGVVKRYFKHSTHFKKPGTSSSIVVHKQVFDKVDHFDINYVRAEDVDMWFRIALKYPVAFSNTITACYMQDDEEVERISLTQKKIKTDPSVEGLIQRLLRLKHTYHEEKYVRDIDIYAANYLLKNIIAALKSKPLISKPGLILNRIKKIRQNDIGYLNILIASFITLKYIVRKRLVNR